jgi:hypothetical protein
MLFHTLPFTFFCDSDTLWTHEKIHFTSTNGRWKDCSCQNYSTDRVYLNILSCSLTDWVMFLQLVDATQCKFLKQFSVRIILRSILCVYNIQHFLKSKQLVFVPVFDVAAMPSNFKWTYEGCSACLHICIFTPRQGIFVIQNTKYSSEHALLYSISFFHLVSLLFYTTLPALNKFF